jgi:hypothetical protein
MKKGIIRMGKKESIPAFVFNGVDDLNVHYRCRLQVSGCRLQVYG